MFKLNMDNDKKKRKNRHYNEVALKSAIQNVLESNMTVYTASKEFGIPWTTLKRNVLRVTEERAKGITQLSMSKIGRPFCLPVEREMQLVSYIIEMQELGFGLTVNKIRELAFKLAEAQGLESFFNKEKKCAGWSWWVSFKNRYGLSLRQPENLSAGRAACSNPVVLQDFYEKLEKVLKDHNLIDSPHMIWNCDETGLMYVNKPEKIVTQIGKKYIYNRSYAEKGTTTTVLACINAAGCFIPPLVIFKGVRNYTELQNGALPNSMTRLSPKGWINADLFLEWLKFFNENIPPARPVFLIMDSHASHITPQVLEYAKSHQIVLFTMPAHTSHLLQPLDVGVFRPLKVAWRSELEKYKCKNPDLIPTRYDFHKLFTPAFETAFSPTNIRAGFKKTGIFPFNKSVLNPEVIAPSRVTDKPDPTNQIQEVLVNEDMELVIPEAKIATNTDPLNEAPEQNNDSQKLSTNDGTITESNPLPEKTDIAYNWNMSFQDYITNASSDVPMICQDINLNLEEIAEKKSSIKVTDILIIPKFTPKPSTRPKRTVPKAQCLTPVDDMVPSQLVPNVDNVNKEYSAPSTSKDLCNNQKQKTKSSIKLETKTKKQKIKKKEEDDWLCHSCNGLYSQDVASKNGADWITCSFCTRPYHLHCQSQEVDKHQEVFMCDSCSVESSSEE